MSAKPSGDNQTARAERSREVATPARSVDVVVDDVPRIWECAVTPSHSAPGVTSMVGYRPLDDGVQVADTADALPTAWPNPVILGGLRSAWL